MFDVSFLVPMHGDYIVFERLTVLAGQLPPDTHPRAALWKPKSESSSNEPWTHAALRLGIEADDALDALCRASETFRVAHESTGMTPPKDFEAWVDPSRSHPTAREPTGPLSAG